MEALKLELLEADQRRVVECEETTALLSLSAQLHQSHEVCATADALVATTRRHVVQQHEWRSIVEQSRAALKGDEDRRFAAMEESKNSALVEREKRIAQMLETLGSKDKVIADLYSQIAKADENLHLALREQKREMAVTQEQLRLDATRLAGLRERTRLENEAAINARDSQRILADASMQRATAAHKSAEREAIKAVLREEASVRAALVQSAVQLLELGEACELQARQALETQRQQVSIEAAALKTKVMRTFASYRPEGWIEDAALDVVDSATTFCIAVAEETDASKGIIAGLRSNLAAVSQRLETQETMLTDIDTISQAKLGALQERCAAAERRLSSLRAAQDSVVAARAKVKSEASALDSLLADHDAEVRELKDLLEEAEARAKRFGRENRHDEVEQLQKKHAILSIEADALRRENGELTAKAKALSASLSADAAGTSALTTENRVLRREVDERRRDQDARVSLMAASMSEADQRAVHADSQVLDLRELLDIREGELAETRVELEGLQDRINPLRDACYAAEQRAAELEREKRAAVDREAERRKEERDARRVAAEEEEAARRLAAEEAELEGITASSTSAGSGVVHATIISGSSRSAAPLRPEDEAYDATDAVIERLENQLVIVKRERDTLRRQVNVAMAEVSASEERRSNTVQKYLTLMNSSDAAPRRELALRQQEADLRRLEHVLTERTTELDTREFENKKKEMTLASKASALKGLRRHESVMQLGAAGSALRLTRALDTASNTSGGAHSSTVNSQLATGEKVPNKLSPLVHRPPLVVPLSSVTHPQLPPRGNRSVSASTTPSKEGPE
jgi:chromosome segregation ATPase